MIDDNKTSDIGALWEQALNQYFLDTKDVFKDYYVDTGKNTKSLLQRTWKVSSIINDQEQQLEDFCIYRHNKGFVDKVRSLVRRNSDIIQSVAQLVSEAASSSFPPAAAIITAFTYIMKVQIHVACP